MNYQFDQHSQEILQKSNFDEFILK